MNIALIGSGRREHALCKKLVESTKNNKIYCIPGNAGTSEIATNLNIDYLNFQLLLKNLKKNKINLVVVGPEEPLVKGIVNFLEKNNIKVLLSGTGGDDIFTGYRRHRALLLNNKIRKWVNLGNVNFLNPISQR